MLQFRLTIPNNWSKLSNTLWSLSDKAIIILLHNGLFKSASTAWRNAKKSDKEVELMWSNAWRYQCCNRVSIPLVQLWIGSLIRTAFIAGRSMGWAHQGNTTPTRTRLGVSLPHRLGVPGLEQQWRCISHQVTWKSCAMGNYLSIGLSWFVLTWRTTQENNLCNAMYVAKHVKARTRSSLHPRHPHRIIELVKHPIPHLENGTGSGNVHSSCLMACYFLVAHDWVTALCMAAYLLCSSDCALLSTVLGCAKLYSHLLYDSVCTLVFVLGYTPFFLYILWVRACCFLSLLCLVSYPFHY